MSKNILIKTIKGKYSNYRIMKYPSGYVVEVRHKSIIKYLKELLSDYLGDTHIHPVFLDKFVRTTIEQCENSIKTFERIKTKINNGKI